LDGADTERAASDIGDPAGHPVSEHDDVILAALTERVLQTVDASERDRTVSLVLNLVSLTLLIRLKLVTLDEAVRQIERVHSQLLAKAPSNGVTDRLSEVIDWLHTCVSDEMIGGTILEGSVQDWENNED
jgi:hypothetical protein